MKASDSLRHGIAHRLRLAREMAGLSQGQVARELGWHRPTISEIEAGRRKVSAEELSTLSEVYGVNTSWVLGEQSSNLAEDKAMLAARELGKLNDDDLERILRLIRALKS